MQRTILLPSLAALLVSTTLSAQSRATASWTFHGDNCGTPIAALNDNHGAGRAGTLTNEYTYGWQATAATTLVGFQLYTTTSALPSASMTCTFYRESVATPGMPDTTAAQTATMTVRNVLDFYGVFFSPPFQVAANEKIWFGQTDSNAILAAGLVTGTAPAIPTYWRRPPATPAWAVTGTILYPAWRLISATDLACLSQLPPKLGTLAGLDLQGGPTGAPAALFLGASNPALALPFCTKLLTSAEVTIAVTTNATGGISLPLAIPNIPALDGALVWCQWWAVGPALTIVGSSGALATLGT